MEFLVQFQSIFAAIFSFLIAIIVIVFVHEFGHYIVARWSGIKADVFSLGFGPVLYARKDRHGTQWQIAALPFGGYVKFKGDKNAASAPDAIDNLSDAQKRETLTGAPLWARAVTVAAGPVFNFIFAFLVFAFMVMSRGVADDPNMVGTLRAYPLAHEIRAGDRLVSVEGINLQDVTSFEDVLNQLPRTEPLSYTVTRAGEQFIAKGPYYFPAQIGSIAPQSAAIDAGLKRGDVITAVNGKSIVSFMELKDAVEAANGAALSLDIWRDGENLTVTLTPRKIDEPTEDGGFSSQWRVGIISSGLFYEPATTVAGPVLAATVAISQINTIISGSLSGMYHLIFGEISTCNLSGPVRIAETSAQMASQGAQSFIWFLAVMSVAIGFLNLLPLPVLDGGHLMFYAYEAIVGRPPHERVLHFLMMAGFALLIALSFFSFGNDISCL